MERKSGNIMKTIRKIMAVAVLVLSAVTAFAQNSSGYRVLNGKVYYNNIILQEADPNTILDLGYGYAKDNENVWLEGKLLPLVDARSFRLKNSPPSSVHSGHTTPPPAHEQSYGLGNLLSDVLGVALGRDNGNKPAPKPAVQPDPGHHHAPNHGHTNIYQERGYEIIDMKVYYNGASVSNASAHSFKDLGCGYAKDSYRVYYCGKKLTDNPSRFTALTDGYAKDSFNVYYFGKKIEASTSGFKVLSDGYAKDAFDAYYCGKEVVGSSASSFKVTGNGYAKDNWETYYLGKKVK